MGEVFTKEWAIQNGERIGVHAKASQTIYDIRPYLRHNQSVLDIGCGAGVLVDKLAKHHYHACGYDTAPENIAYARKYFQGYYYDHFPDGCEFGVITMVHVFEHLGQPLEYLMKVKDILADGGILHIIVPNNKTASGYFGEQFKLLIYDSEHKTFWEPDSLINILQKAGYRILNVHERLYWGMLIAVGLSKYYRMIFRKKNKPTGSSGANNGSKLQGLFDGVDYILPCITRIPGKSRIFNEIVVTARKLR